MRGGMWDKARYRRYISPVIIDERVWFVLFFGTVIITFCSNFSEDKGTSSSLVRGRLLRRYRVEWIAVLNRNNGNRNNYCILCFVRQYHKIEYYFAADVVYNVLREVCQIISRVQSQNTSGIAINLCRKKEYGFIKSIFHDQKSQKLWSHERNPIDKILV